MLGKLQTLSYVNYNPYVRIVTNVRLGKLQTLKLQTLCQVSYKPQDMLVTSYMLGKLHSQVSCKIIQTVFLVHNFAKIVWTYKLSILNVVLLQSIKSMDNNFKILGSLLLYFSISTFFITPSQKTTQLLKEVSMEDTCFYTYYRFNSNYCS